MTGSARHVGGPALLAGVCACIHVISTACSADLPERHQAAPDTAGPGLPVLNTSEVWGPDEGWSVSDTILQLGVIHGDAPHVFSRVLGAVRLSDGRVVVLDGHTGEVRAFAVDGRHQWTAGGTGSGPGEFMNPLDLARLEGDRLQVEDEHSVAVFEADGQLVEHAALDWPRILESGPFGSECRPIPRVMGDHLYLATCDTDVSVQRDTGPWRIESWLVRSTWSLDRLDTIGVFLREDAWAVSIGGGTLYMPGILGERGIMAVGGDPPRLVFAQDHEYRLEVYDLAGETPHRTHVIERSGGTRAPSQAELDSAWARWERRAERARELYGGRLDLAPVRNQLAAPDSVSVVGDVLIDDLNMIWVKHDGGSLDDASTVRLWGVFTGEGIYLGEVDLPGNLTPHQIGEDFVLGVLLDEFGVEYVVVLSLDRHR